MRRLPEVLIPASIAAALAAYWATCSLLIHRSFHSNAWDLGLITQVIWNTSRGEWFEFSFRAISFAGDHWQPSLVALVPLIWIGAGVEGLLVAQAVLLAAAVVPLYYSVRPSSAVLAATLVCAGYGLSLAVAQAVSFDFHMEAIAPVLAFTAVYGLVAKRQWVFIVAALALLTMKEDAALFVLALVWLAVAFYGWRRKAAIVAGIAVVYAAVVNLWLIPHYRGDDLNPLRERYGYLGDSVLEILVNIPLQPGDVAEHLFAGHAFRVVAFLLLASGFALVLRPKMLLGIAPLVILPLLSDDRDQNHFDLHYLVVPATYAMCCFVVLLDTRRDSPRWLPGAPVHAAAIAAVMAVVFAFESPLPPSFAAEGDRFDVDHHASVASSFVKEIPEDAIVSAQSAFVPHLAEREDIFTFPRVLDAQYVLIDHFGPKPLDDLDAGYDVCLAALPQLGFDRVREEDGIELWEKRRPAETVPGVPEWCSGVESG